MNFTDVFGSNSWIFILLLLWALPWKGVAMWSAAQRKQKWWFIIILLTNTLAILEIIYLFFVLPYLDKKNAGRVA